MGYEAGRWAAIAALRSSLFMATPAYAAPLTTDQRDQVSWKPLLRYYRVDAVLAGEVHASEEKLEIQPAAKADDHGA